jgi:type 2 lantibiotic biosynthesis protein LanM
MNRSDISTAAWYRALTLAERLRAHEDRKQTEALSSEAAQRAERLARKWKSQPPFAGSDLFSQRLLMEGTDEIGWLRILGAASSTLKKDLPVDPGWLREIKQAFSGADHRHVEEDSIAQSGIRGYEGLLAAFAPVIDRACNRLRDSVQSLSRSTMDLPFDSRTVVQLVLPGLALRLLEISSRTLVLELNVARLRGLLKGESPEERFRSYCQLLRNPDVLISLLEEYPVLARLITECAAAWTDACLEFLARLSADWGDLLANFCQGSHPGLLTGIEFGAGDTHREGRSVAVVSFQNGFRLVYKPRSLAVDLHFQELLRWINRRKPQLSFRILNILARSSHGWVEYVSAGSCTTVQEVQRFYQRQGGYLALLYALEAVDIHSENLIAAGEHPVLIDLESLLHPRAEMAGLSDARHAADDSDPWTVLRVGLLPFLLFGEAEDKGIDMSGMGYRAGQVSPMGLPRWEDPGTDSMRLIHKQVPLPERCNRPLLGAREVSLKDYRADVVTGFTQVYELLVGNRDSLFSRGPLSLFAKDEVRFIARDTQTYGSLLEASYHPDVLRDALERDRLLDLLWIEVENRPELARLIRAEQADLVQGAIPIFTTEPDSPDLWTSTKERIAGFFNHPSLSRVQHRLTIMGEQDLARQVRLIEGALT